MRVLCFLLILLVSILLIVSYHFLLLQIDEVYNEKKRLNTVCTCDSTQQETLPGSLKVGRIYFKLLDLSMQRRSLLKKQINCQCKLRLVQDFIVLK